MSQQYQDLPLTNFPDNIDTFTTWLNIVAADGPLIQQYQAAIEAGNQTLANQVLAKIPQGTQKIITATDLNTLTQAMLALERFYSTNIQQYIENKQEDWITVIQKFSYKGVWASGTSYVENNFIQYANNGLNLLYIATSDPPVGTLPTNQNYWRLLTVQGQQGASGEGLSYRQEWINSESYGINDAVTYDGILWAAIQPSQNQQPMLNSNYWQYVINFTTTVYPIQPTPPTNQNVGSLWFNTQNNPTKYYYLATLTSPATSSDIALGQQAYDEGGNLIVGTGAIIPIGGIIIWSGSASDIPSQWALCNGQNGTPDLTDKFVIGAGNSYNVNSNGGSDSINIGINNLPSHTHSLSNVSLSDAGSHRHSLAYGSQSDRGGSDGSTITYVDGNGFGSYGGYSASTGSNGSHTHTIEGSLSNTGGGEPCNYLPPYYALCYIMRIS